MNRTLAIVHGIVACAAMAGCTNDQPPPARPSAAEPMIVVYADIAAERMSKVATRYRGESGVLVNYMLNDSESLTDSLVKKEHRPGADLLLISGAGPLANAVDADILRPLQSEVLTAALPDRFRDPDGYWYAVGRRAEVIAFDKRNVQPADLGSYADLGDSRWIGKLCLQRGSAGRSLSLVATMIASMGERNAELAVRGWRANLAASAFETQREILDAIAAGSCAVAIVSSDQAALFLRENTQSDVGIHVPPPDQGGAAESLVAVGVTRHANDAAMATRFLEWLTSPAGQLALHEAGADYPLPGVTRQPEAIAVLPSYSASDISTSRAGYFHREAALLMERARYR